MSIPSEFCSKSSSLTASPSDGNKDGENKGSSSFFGSTREKGFVSLKNISDMEDNDREGSVGGKKKEGGGREGSDGHRHRLSLMGLKPLLMSRSVFDADL